MDDFTHTPLLLPHSTRLVKITSSEATSDIKGTVSEVDLDNLLSSGYTTLSYCWGSLSKTVPITLNHHSFHVTENLHAALQVLRKLFGSDLFWIDAICINQSDLGERSHQVQEMRPIYERSKRTVIWLGPETTETATTMRWVEKLSRFWQSLRTTYGTDKTTLYQACIDNLEDLFDSSQGVVDFAPLEGLRKLLLRPWFERVWVVQEATIPGKNMLLLCGDSVIEWDALATATGIITHLMWRQELKEFFTQVPFMNDSSLRRFFNVDKQRQNRTSTLTYLQILGKYRLFKSSDPRDKIYALRGLMRDLSKDELSPDYFLPPQTVFTQVARLSIRSKSPFEYLGFCDYSTRDVNYPSWIVDWSNPSLRHPLAKRQIHDSSSEDNSVYHAATLPSSFYENCHMRCSIRDGKVLSVSGLKIDMINSIAKFDIPSSYSPCSFSHEAQIFCGRPALYDLHIPENSMYRDSSETLKSAYSRTVVADVAKLGNVRARNFNITLDYWCHVRDYQTPSRETEYRQEWGSFLFSTRGRSLFHSREGYLGLGPSDMQPNDWICAFFGGDVLYVLRSVGDRYHFIGECYVHGLMNGEAGLLLRNGSRTVEDFEIE